MRQNKNMRMRRLVAHLGTSEHKPTDPLRVGTKSVSVMILRPMSKIRPYLKRFKYQEEIMLHCKKSGAKWLQNG